MCGICGSLGPPKWQDHSLSQSIVAKMCATIAHRGNDGNGMYIDSGKGIALGHQRLSIIDIEGGNQPYHDNERKAYIVFNGEIFNYLELRDELKNAGCQFRSKSDTEVILQAYLTWGESCVDRLRGMFAFAIWDESNGKLFCARDRVGIKPFYYFWDGTHFIFASEIKALLSHPRVDRTQDPGSLATYLRFRYIPSPGTIYKNISKLPAAHVLSVQDQQLKLRQFWKVPQITSDNVRDGHGEATTKLREELEQAMSIHLISDVSLGAFLSGGVDSTIIVAMMNQFSHSPIKTHTASFKDLSLDEGPFAREAADFFKTDHRDSLVQIHVADDLEKIIYHLDEPLADASAIPTYYLCREARKRVKVCLSGDGGDELFGGYNWYGELNRLQSFNQLVPLSLSKFISDSLGKVIPETLRGAALIKNLGLSPMQQHLNLVDCFGRGELESLCKFNYAEEYSGESIFENVYRSISTDAGDVVRSAQLADLQTYMAEDILMKVDKMSMAHGLEVRVPFLDHRVVEQAMKIPTSYNLRGKQRKLALKDSVSDLVPGRFMQRGKHGFSAPVDQWLKHDLKDLFGDLLLAPSASNSGLFERKEVLKLWKKLSRQSYHVGISERLWTLFCFEMWNHVYHK